jgi:hypothetical protein
MAFFNSGRIATSGERIHDHEDSTTGGANLKPVSVAANEVTIGGVLNFGNAGAQLDFDPVTDAIAASQNNYNPNPGVGWHWCILTVTGAVNITGLDVSGFTDISGTVFITILGTGTVTFKNASASSTAANRFSIGADIALGLGNAIAFSYDPLASRWRALGTFTQPGTFTLPDHFHAAAGDGGVNLVPDSIVLSKSLQAEGIFDAGVISAAQNDIAIGQVTVAKWSPTGATRALNGMVPFGSGHRVIVVNYSTTNILNVNHDNAGSGAANRFLCAGSVTYPLNFNDAVECWYDLSVNRWRVLGH